MTIREALSLGQIEDSEVLLSFVLKKDRAWLFANPENKLSSLQATSYKLLIAKRSRHWPAAYLTGHKEFYGLKFKVNSNVLIPRPETELLVELALEILQTTNYSLPTTIVDIGTGSGAVIISITKSLRAERSNLKFYATDVSKAALGIAKQNARHHGMEKRIKFIKSDLIRNLKLEIRNLLLVCNLPYLTPAQVRSNPDLKHEPRSALVAGKDGLKYYRELFKQLTLYPSPFTLFLEHDPSQVSKLKSLAKKHFPNSKIRFHKDLSKKNRICQISFGGL